MNKDEILDVLCDKGIITLIGAEYLLTEKYKELLTSPTLIDAPPLEERRLDQDAILNGKTNGTDWPIEVIEATGRSRATAIMDICEIPTMASKGYRLRGLTNEAVNILGNIVATKDIDPSTFLDAIRIYYKYTEMPKSFKNFLLEGDVLEVYKEHIEGSLKQSLVSGPNIENKNEWR